MMRPEFLDVKDIMQDSDVLKLFEAVHDYGGAVRFVGGAVRDALAGLKGFDIDLATDLTPDELVEACTEKGIKTVSLGLKFAKTGVVMGNRVFEVSSLHRALPEGVKYSDFSFTDDWNADAATRDLTINAVYADEDGNVFDYYNGIEDLEKGVVRFIGNAKQKIMEQPIRIMRFFRFYSIFSKTAPDLKSLKACVENKDLLKTVAIEQIREEFFKILATSNAANVLEMMAENDILSFVLPQKINTRALKTLDTLVRFNHMDADMMRRLFVLFEPDQVLAESLAVRLKLTKVQKNKMMNLARFSFDSAQFNDLAYIKRVVYAHDKAFVKDKILIALAKQNVEDCNLKKLFTDIDDMEVPVFPLGGKDLIGLGMQDCVPVKEMMAGLKNIWIASDFTLSKEGLEKEALKLINP
ncbi:MAG: CCA tRNA nucleotidyltransferase [Alphaproteobacteria bacterium]|nr:CCA tRNA nucleotidyltransferase [Alphaproteobacteria bacterium]